MKSTVTLPMVSLLFSSSLMAESQPLNQMNADVADVQNRCIVRLNNTVDSN